MKLVAVRCARVYVSTKNWAKAITEYELLKENFPDDPNILEQLGKCYMSTGDIRRAKNLYERAAAIYLEKGEAVKAERVKKDIERYFGSASPQENPGGETQ